MQMNDMRELDGDGLASLRLPASRKWLRDKAAQATRQEVADVAQQGPFTGEDESGTVAITVDDTGVPVGIRVGHEWGDRRRQSELGAAVLAAYTDGLRRALIAHAARWSQRREQGPSPAGAGEPPQPPGFFESLPLSASEAEWRTAVDREFYRITDEFEKAHRSVQAVATTAFQETTTSSPAGFFIVRRRGRSVVSLAINPRRTATSTADLARDAISVLRAM
jgi:hypothetical protein